MASVAKPESAIALPILRRRCSDPVSRAWLNKSTVRIGSSLRSARAALVAGGAAPTILNAANEVAVEAFLAGRIGFPGIPALVETVMAQAESDGLREPASVEEALAVDHIGRDRARTLLPQFAAKAS